MHLECIQIVTFYVQQALRRVQCLFPLTLRGENQRFVRQSGQEPGIRGNYLY